MARIGLIQFPGSNCDADCIDTFERSFSLHLKPVWHEATQLPTLDAIILPGGFSYGDYLRSGALASCSPVMREVKDFAERGGPVLGICNGFQILTESHLLPGMLLRNARRKFICQEVELGVAQGTSAYHQRLTGKSYKMPIAHGEGRYYIDPKGLHELEVEGQILFRYQDHHGQSHEGSNPNGATAHIAGIVSKNGRVLGMMPHPERAADGWLGSTDGKDILSVFLETANS